MPGYPTQCQQVSRGAGSSPLSRWRSCWPRQGGRRPCTRRSPGVSGTTADSTCAPIRTGGCGLSTRMAGRCRQLRRGPVRAGAGIRHLGYRAAVELVGEPAYPACSPGPAGPAGPAQRRGAGHVPAVPHRHTDRGRSARSRSARAATQLQHDAIAGTTLVLVEDRVRGRWRIGRGRGALAAAQPDGPRRAAHWIGSGAATPDGFPASAYTALTEGETTLRRAGCRPDASEFRPGPWSGPAEEAGSRRR